MHDVDADLLPFLDSAHPDVVWPLLHGASGEDGSIRDVLELVGVPYVGTGPRESRAAWSKPVAKNVVLGAGLCTPEYVTLPRACSASSVPSPCSTRSSRDSGSRSS